MAFPTKTTATSEGTSSPLSINIQSPANGDLVLVFFASNRSNIPDLPTDWISIDTQSRSINANCSYRAFYKVCNGTEGASLSGTVGGTPGQVGAISYKFAAGTYTGTPEAASVNSNDTTPNPPNLAPTWGAADALWIAGMWNNGNGAPTAFPSTADATYSGTTVNIVRMYVQHAEKNVSSENPGAYTIPFSQGNIGFTAALRGVSGGETVRRRVMLKQPPAPTKAKISKISKLLAGISLIFNPDSGTPPAISTDKKFWWFRRRKR